MQWDYAIDFGTDAVRVLTAGESDIRVEAACAAFRGDAGQPFAWGDRAYAFVGREAPDMKIRLCMRSGLCLDLPLLNEWVGRLLSAGSRKRRNVLMTLSPQTADSTAEAIMSTLTDVNVDVLGLVPSDLAVGLGAEDGGEDGRFVLDIGASQISFSAQYGGRRVAYLCQPEGMDRVDEAVIQLARRRLGLCISPRTARLLKHSAFSRGEEALSCAVFDPTTRLPREEKIPLEIAQDAMEETVSRILSVLRRGIDRLSGDLTGLLMEKGLILCGGGSRIGGMDKLLSGEVGVPVRLSGQPREAAVLGLRCIMKKPELAFMIEKTKDAGVRL